MANVVRVTGIQQLAQKLKARKGHYATAFERGLKKGGLYLQRRSQKLVPIDTGALRNSAFTRAKGAGFDVVVQVGYTSSYAIYVHENMSAHHVKGIAKFLEVPYRMQTVRTTILDIVKVEVAKEIKKDTK